MNQQFNFSNKKSFSKTFLFRTFLNGFMITLPVLIMLLILVFLVRLILRLIVPIASVLSLGTDSNHWIFSVLALVIVCVFFLMVGLFVGTSYGKKVFSWGEEKILKPVPFYSTINNIVEQFRGQGERPFRQVVLVDPYNSGALMTAFLVEHINEETVVVYVPTAPNPTNGLVFHIKESQVIYTDAKTEDAMASIIGMGAGSKKLFKTPLENA